MWCLRMFRPMLPGESMEAALTRLSGEPDVMAVDRGEPLPVVYVRSQALSHLRPEEIAVLVSNPQVLPLDVRVAWVDGEVERHLREDGLGVREAHRAALEGVRSALGGDRGAASADPGKN